ncbi:hypothetical protein [Brevundimonas sp. UBA5866]|nr:hypothetical protein [Brevundimonas sp. UBA5866]
MNIAASPIFWHERHMKMLIDFLAGIVAFLAAAAMAQFGLTIDRATQPIEVKRLPECHSTQDERPATTVSPRC